MIRRTGFPFSAASGVAALSARCAPPVKPVDVHRIEAAADFVAQEQISDGSTPGMTIAVAKNGKVVFIRGYGRAIVEKGVRAGSDSVYKIGSVTKQFTAALILRLEEAGRVSLRDPITKYLPDYPTQGHLVTVRHLLNHTSGIKSFNLDEDGGKLFRRDLTYRDIVDRFGKQPFDFKPGDKFAYNNTAYYLLGEIIARVTGKSFAESMERELLQPLGLRRTLHLADGRDIPNLAQGYEHKAGKFITAPYVSAKSVGAAGALCSTATDLVRWTHLLHSGKVVSPASLRQMTMPTVLTGGKVTDYGLGLFVGELDGHPRIFHGGRGLGFLSLLSHYPNDGLTIAVLMNNGTDRQKRDAVERAVSRAALGLQVRDLPLTASDIARYEGTYAVPLGTRTGELRVFSDGGQLKGQVAGGSVIPLRYQGDDRFIGGQKDDIRLVFSVANGRGQSVTIDLRGQMLQGTRKP